MLASSSGNEMEATVLEAITHCSPVIIFEDKNSLEDFQDQTKSFRTISAQQPFKVNYVYALKSPEKASKSTPVNFVKKYKDNCEAVFVLLPQSNPFIKTKNFKNFIFNAQKPKLDYIFFVTKNFNNDYNIVVPKWTTALRFFYLVHFDETLLKYLILKTEAIENNPLEHTPREYISAISVRKFLNGKIFKVTSLLIDPYVTLKDGAPIGGCFYNMVLYGSQKFNFTFSIEIPAWAGASQFPNGTWRGPMREVIDGEKDFILGTGHTYDRNPYLDYPCFFELTGINYVTANPQKFVEWRAIVYTFEPITWLCLATTTLSMLGVIFVAMRRHTEEINKTHIFIILGITFNPLLEHSAAVPKVTIIRLIYSINILMSLVIITYFKSDFIAFVSYPSHEKIPLYFRELGERTDFNVMLMNLNAAESVFFNKTTNPLYAGIRQRMIFESDWVKCMTAAAFEPNTVCIGLENMVKAIWASNLTLNRLYSPVAFSKESAYYFIWGVGFTRHSKYVDSFASIIRLLRDTGNIRRWMEDHYEFKSVNSIKWLQQDGGPLYSKIMGALKPQMGLSVAPFRLSNILLSLIIWGIGIVIAGISFLLEFVVVVSQKAGNHGVILGIEHGQ
ncbi:unnamed protein product [Allacma fusca]|uniref:Uncharacterized protein n=1 Tax=Allacma fusca TaxID=39272 RepID=A0A8J2P0Q4_9HEXA|nr:unnamed protein product [Allacma fusca]